jgi:hypothetical protein
MTRIAFGSLFAKWIKREEGLEPCPYWTAALFFEKADPQGWEIVLDLPIAPCLHY